MAGQDLEFVFSFGEGLNDQSRNGRKGCGVDLFSVILLVWSTLVEPEHVVPIDGIVGFGISKHAEFVRSQGQVLSKFLVDVKRSVAFWIQSQTFQRIGFSFFGIRLGVGTISIGGFGLGVPLEYGRLFVFFEPNILRFGIIRIVINWFGGRVDLNFRSTLAQEIQLHVLKVHSDSNHDRGKIPRSVNVSSPGNLDAHFDHSFRLLSPFGIDGGFASRRLSSPPGLFGNGNVSFVKFAFR
mmetsp:Transcript_8630/g.18637  ORF Transcript_8630/g.18637 Transcript_8630/m.18637 type:complete len:239 (+) Transcript_8630:930-1646(+)